MQLILTAGGGIVEAAIHLIVRSMISRYGEKASARAANRARVLEACGDRNTSRYWDLVSQGIEEFDQAPRRRSRFFADDDPDLIAAVRAGVFGDGVYRVNPEDTVTGETGASPPDKPDEPEPSSK